MRVFGLEFPFWGQVTYFIGNSVIIENDIIDDDDDMVDHFNIISESDVGIDVDQLDEDQEDTEEEYWYRCYVRVWAGML